MISMVRLGLSVLLMMLQLASPLIHAHKNENFKVSFHLPEFEQISQLLDKSLMTFVSATQNDQVVTVSAGMKNNKRRVLSTDNFIVSTVLSLVIFSLFQNSITKFFVQTESNFISFFKS
jgi:hypothetical protein